GDLEILRSELAPLLEQADLELVEAKDGDTAVQMLRRGLADIGLVDLVLPDMSGLHLLREVSQEKLVPIILVAAREDARVAVLARELGAIDFLIKPLQTDDLLRTFQIAMSEVPPPARP